jgi:outer membrane lipoprotein-sorting protein/peroxiredoxin
MLVRFSLLSIAAVMMVCAMFAPAAVAQDDNLDEIVKQLKKAIADTESWTADLSMEMTVQGMTMEWTGNVINRGGQSVSNMNIEMMGQKMSMRNIVDMDGTLWVEMDMGGTTQVMKTDAATAVKLEEFDDAPSTSGAAETLDQLGRMLDSENVTLDGRDTINGTAVYLISAKVLEDMKSALDQSGAMAQMGMTPSKMNLAFGVEDRFIRRLEMVTDDGTPFMTTSYTNLALNPVIEDSAFSYTPPPGVAVQDMAEMMAGVLDGPDAATGERVLGAPVPDFTGTNLSGETVSLSDYEGKIVLIDFWATWCGPCVSELPNVIDAYTAYHDRGFEILAISLDDSREDLEAFLKDHPEMTWVQLFDGKGWESDIAVEYNVESIPTTILLDQEGNIVRQDLRGEALANALADLIGG